MPDPLVTVGLASYNGERTIREAVESLLAQRYESLELIVSDDASSDSTPAICEELARRDGRLRLYRNQENLGGYANFNRTLALASGELFMWASHDDVWDPEMVEACVQLLRDRSVALAYPGGRLLDEGGAPIDHPTDDFDTRGLRVTERPAYILGRLRSFHVFFGLTRTETLRQVGGLRDVWSACVPVVIGLSLRGHVAHEPRVLFHKRTHGETALSDAWRRRMLTALSLEARDQRLDKTVDELNRELRDATIATILDAPLPRAHRAAAAAGALRAFEQHRGVRLPFFRLREWLPARSYLALAAIAARPLAPVAG